MLRTFKNGGKLEQKKKTRGLGKKPALFCTSIRLSEEVIAYFNKQYPRHKQAKMREVLTQYVQSQSQPKELPNEEVHVYLGPSA